MSMDEDFPTNSQGELSDSRKGRTANWLTSMRSEHADAFSQDSDLVKEARARYFTTHSWDWIHGNMEDLSNIFKGLAQEAGLLGESIFEIQWLWKGPEHLKHANYIFQTQPKGLKFLRAVSARESLRALLVWFSVINIICSAVLEGIKPSLHGWFRFLLVGVEHFALK